jgi:predicted transcriptional regulator
MSHQLINFNIPTDLKDCLDDIARAKRLSRTAIINQLLEGYCRKAQLEMKSRKHADKVIREEADDLPLIPVLVDHEYFHGGWSL